MRIITQSYYTTPSANLQAWKLITASASANSNSKTLSEMSPYLITRPKQSNPQLYAHSITLTNYESSIRYIWDTTQLS